MLEKKLVNTEEGTEKQKSGRATAAELDTYESLH